ncbi:hypothetical protein [Nocardia sp. NPDC005366]|uniref:hypothetical protein n=1 Tax=Nocardia sp. NPDC005366 TaxID=3156878 RepID=UPI0033A366EE
MGTWEVQPVRKNTVEVADSDYPEIRYIVEGFRSRLTVSAFEGGELIETSSISRAIHEVVLESIDRSGNRVFIAFIPSGESPISRVVQNDEEYLVEISGDGHVEHLSGELKKRVIPDCHHIDRLGEELKRNTHLRNALKENTEFGLRILVAERISNAANAACAAACLLCTLGSYAGCVACSLCIELPIHVE